MALSPLDPIEIITEVEADPEPSRTYQLNPETNEIGGLIDGEDALRQFIEKTIRTARYRFFVYTDEYGCELEDLIGEDITPELLDSEIPSVITDALINDDRIVDVTNFVVEQQADAVYITFDVEVNMSFDKSSSKLRYRFGSFITGIILIGEEAV